MTLSSTTTKVQYDGDGSTSTFATTFKFFLNAHVEVIHTDSNGTDQTYTEGTHYTLTGKGLEAGGTVTMETGFTPASDERLTIKRVAPETQLTDLILGGSFSSTSVEDALDLLTMLIQQHTEELARTFSLAETTESSADVVFPDPEANKILGWNSAGDDLENKSLTSIGDTLDTSITGQSAGDYLRASSGTQWENRSNEETKSDLDIVLMSQVFGG
jgi:hypothetical protein